MLIYIYEIIIVQSVYKENMHLDKAQKNDIISSEGFLNKREEDTGKG